MPDEKAKNKRSSIKKKENTFEESSPSETFGVKLQRRISFSGKKTVKEFCDGENIATIWGTSFEESAGSSAHSSEINQNCSSVSYAKNTEAVGRTAQNKKIILPPSNCIKLPKSKKTSVIPNYDKENILVSSEYLNINTESSRIPISQNYLQYNIYSNTKNNNQLNDDMDITIQNQDQNNILEENMIITARKSLNLTHDFKLDYKLNRSEQRNLTNDISSVSSSLAIHESEVDMFKLDPEMFKTKMKSPLKKLKNNNFVIPSPTNMDNYDIDNISIGTLNTTEGFMKVEKMIEENEISKLNEQKMEESMIIENEINEKKNAIQEQNNIKSKYSRHTQIFPNSNLNESELDLPKKNNKRQTILLNENLDLSLTMNIENRCINNKKSEKLIQNNSQKKRQTLIFAGDGDNLDESVTKIYKNKCDDDMEIEETITLSENKNVDFKKVPQDRRTVIFENNQISESTENPVVIYSTSAAAFLNRNPFNPSKSKNTTIKPKIASTTMHEDVMEQSLIENQSNLVNYHKTGAIPKRRTIFYDNEINLETSVQEDTRFPIENDNNKTMQTKQTENKENKILSSTKRQTLLCSVAMEIEDNLGDSFIEHNAFELIRSRKKLDNSKSSNKNYHSGNEGLMDIKDNSRINFPTKDSNINFKDKTLKVPVAIDMDESISDNVTRVNNLLPENLRRQTIHTELNMNQSELENEEIKKSNNLTIMPETDDNISNKFNLQTSRLDEMLTKLNDQVYDKTIRKTNFNEQDMDIDFLPLDECNINKNSADVSNSMSKLKSIYTSISPVATLSKHSIFPSNSARNLEKKLSQTICYNTENDFMNESNMCLDKNKSKFNNNKEKRQTILKEKTLTDLELSRTNSFDEENNQEYQENNGEAIHKSKLRIAPMSNSSIFNPSNSARSLETKLSQTICYNTENDFMNESNMCLDQNKSKFESNKEKRKTILKGNKSMMDLELIGNEVIKEENYQVHLETKLTDNQVLDKSKRQTILCKQDMDIENIDCLTLDECNINKNLARLSNSQMSKIKNIHKSTPPIAPMSKRISSLNSARNLEKNFSQTICFNNENDFMNESNICLDQNKSKFDTNKEKRQTILKEKTLTDLELTGINSFEEENNQEYQENIEEAINKSKLPIAPMSNRSTFNSATNLDKKMSHTICYNTENDHMNESNLCFEQNKSNFESNKENRQTVLKANKSTMDLELIGNEELKEKNDQVHLENKLTDNPVHDKNKRQTILCEQNMDVENIQHINKNLAAVSNSQMSKIKNIHESTPPIAPMSKRISSLNSARNLEKEMSQTICFNTENKLMNESNLCLDQNKSKNKTCMNLELTGIKIEDGNNKENQENNGENNFQISNFNIGSEILSKIEKDELNQKSIQDTINDITRDITNFDVSDIELDCAELEQSFQEMCQIIDSIKFNTKESRKTINYQHEPEVKSNDMEISIVNEIANAVSAQTNELILNSSNGQSIKVENVNGDTKISVFSPENSCTESNNLSYLCTLPTPNTGSNIKYLKASDQILSPKKLTPKKSILLKSPRKEIILRNSPSRSSPLKHSGSNKIEIENQNIRNTRPKSLNFDHINKSDNLHFSTSMANLENTIQLDENNITNIETKENIVHNSHINFLKSVKLSESLIDSTTSSPITFCSINDDHITSADNIDKTKLSLVDNSFITPNNSPAFYNEQKYNVDVRNDHQFKIPEIYMKKENKNITKSMEPFQSNIADISRNQTMCSRCKNCRRSIDTTNIENFRLELPEIKPIDFSCFDKYRNVPTVKDVLTAFKLKQEDRKSLSFHKVNNEELVLFPETPSYEMLLDNLAEQHKEEYLKNMQITPFLPLAVKFEKLLENKFSSSNEPWKLQIDHLHDHSILEFSHKKTQTFEIVFKYLPQKYFTDEIKFLKVIPRKSTVYREHLWTPQQSLISMELWRKIPSERYLTSNYPKSKYLNECLDYLNSKCIEAIENTAKVMKAIIMGKASLEYYEDSFAVRRLYRRDIPGKFINNIDILIKIDRINEISYRNLVHPNILKFDRSIETLPIGVKFLEIFLTDPLKYYLD